MFCKSSPILSQYISVCISKQLFGVVVFRTESTIFKMYSAATEDWDGLCYLQTKYLNFPDSPKGKAWACGSRGPPNSKKYDSYFAPDDQTMTSVKDLMTGLEAKMYYASPDDWQQLCDDSPELWACDVVENAKLYPVPDEK